ncbi:MAG: flagellar basal body-associated FliL family protein [Methylovulum sp.]|nr:flagellar basal body-associated FliL family protein [Methylovulum sp.]
MRPLVLLLSFLLMPVFALANEGEKAEAGGPQYVEIGPKLIVNLANAKQLMKISPQLMVEGAAVEQVKKNMPALKNALIMLYSGRKAEDLASAGQREALRKETAEVIEKTLEKYGSSEGFKEVFFTDFRIN